MGPLFGLRRRRLCFFFALFDNFLIVLDGFLSQFLITFTDCSQRYAACAAFLILRLLYDLILEFFALLVFDYDNFRNLLVLSQQHFQFLKLLLFQTFQVIFRLLLKFRLFLVVFFRSLLHLRRSFYFNRITFLARLFWLCDIVWILNAHVIKLCTRLFWLLKHWLRFILSNLL